MNTYQIINDRIYKMMTVEYMLYGLAIVSCGLFCYSNQSLDYIRKNNTEVTSGHMRSLVQTSAASYFVAAGALLFLIIFSVTLCTDEKHGTIKRIIMYPLPVILTVISFVACSVQTLSHQNKFVENKVPNEYYTWKNIFTMISVIQVILIFYYLIADCGNYNSYIKYFIFIIAIFNIISICIMQTILSFFCTDG